MQGADSPTHFVLARFHRYVGLLPLHDVGERPPSTAANSDKP